MMTEISSSLILQNAHEIVFWVRAKSPQVKIVLGLYLSTSIRFRLAIGNDREHITIR